MSRENTEPSGEYIQARNRLYDELFQQIRAVPLPQFLAENTESITQIITARFEIGGPYRSAQNAFLDAVGVAMPKEYSGEVLPGFRGANPKKLRGETEEKIVERIRQARQQRESLKRIPADTVVLLTLLMIGIADSLQNIRADVASYNLARILREIPQLIPVGKQGLDNLSDQPVANDILENEAQKMSRDRFDDLFTYIANGQEFADNRELHRLIACATYYLYREMPTMESGSESDTGHDDPAGSRARLRRPRPGMPPRGAKEPLPKT